MGAIVSHIARLFKKHLSAELSWKLLGILAEA